MNGNGRLEIPEDKKAEINCLLQLHLEVFERRPKIHFFKSAVALEIETPHTYVSCRNSGKALKSKKNNRKTFYRQSVELTPKTE